MFLNNIFFDILLYMYMYLDCVLNKGIYIFKIIEVK